MVVSSVVVIRYPSIHVYAWRPEGWPHTLPQSSQPHIYRLIPRPLFNVCAVNWESSTNLTVLFFHKIWAALAAFTMLVRLLTSSPLFYCRVSPWWQLFSRQFVLKCCTTLTNPSDGCHSTAFCLPLSRFLVAFDSTTLLKYSSLSSKVRFHCRSLRCTLWKSLFSFVIAPSLAFTFWILNWRLHIKSIFLRLSQLSKLLSATFMIPLLTLSPWIPSPVFCRRTLLMIMNMS